MGIVWEPGWEPSELWAIYAAKSDVSSTELRQLIETIVGYLPRFEPAGEHAQELDLFLERLRSDLKQRIEHERLANADRRAHERVDRLRASQEKRAAMTAVEPRRCTRCQKKPARIDDLCKKCARETGIVVHGKIT